jgi:O-antigen ligase
VSAAIDKDERVPSALSRLTSARTAMRIAVCCEAGIDASALPFFPLLVIVPRGVAVLISVAGLCAAGLILSTGGRKPRPALATAGALLGCLVLWGAASAIWSVDWLRSLIVAARLAGLFAAGLALVGAADSIRAPGRLTFILLGSLAFALALAAADLATHGAVGAPFTDRAYQPAGLNRASVAFAILLLPMTAVLVRRSLPVCALLLATVTGALIFILAGTTAKGALAAGLLVGFLCFRSRTRAAHAAAIISVLVIITAPLTFAQFGSLPVLTETADGVKLSAGHRLWIWSFAGDRIAERPLSGWGLDSARSIPGGKDLIRPGESWLPLHPHNAPLQLWLELGVPGAVLFALMVAYVWHALAIAPWSPMFGAAAGASLTSALIACVAAYGIWQEWWLGVLWFSLFGVLATARAASATIARENTSVRPLSMVTTSSEDDGIAVGFSRRPGATAEK